MYWKIDSKNLFIMQSIDSEIGNLNKSLKDLEDNKNTQHILVETQKKIILRMEMKQYVKTKMSKNVQVW